ncbi:MAG: hypothetical protein IT454_02500 [Planctomycetes bacterium]|nr:hypothetical protein [Planctomycetota bacterium]
MLLQLHGWIDELNEVHLDHLGRAWLHWRAALRSPELSLRQLRRMESRIDAHADALLLGAESARATLEAALVGDEDDLARAAADVLLLGALGDGCKLLRDALAAAPTPARADLLLDAIWLRPSPALVDSLEAQDLERAPARLQIAQRLALAAVRRSGPPSPPLSALLSDDDVRVRRWAWLLLALDANEPFDRALWERQLSDATPQLREVLFAAAAQRRQEWLVNAVRERAEHDLVAARWLAVLGGPADFERLLAVARRAAFGPERFLVLASSGDARALPFLVESCALPLPADASAAAWAFRLLTGHDVHSLERVASVPPGSALPDAFDALFLDEVFLPDLARARAWVEQHGAELAPGRRWRRGLDLDALQGPATDALDPLSLVERAWRARAAPGADAWSMPGELYPLPLR